MKNWISDMNLHICSQEKPQKLLPTQFLTTVCREVREGREEEGGSSHGLTDLLISRIFCLLLIVIGHQTTLHIISRVCLLLQNKIKS